MLYKEKFPVGTPVRTKARSYLEKFKTEWKYHHPLSVDQIKRQTGSTGFVRLGSIMEATCPMIWSTLPEPGMKNALNQLFETVPLPTIRNRYRSWKNTVPL